MRLPMDGENVDIPQVSRMVDDFMAAGFNYFDTARPYIQGKSELAVKDCISRRYPRESFVLTNKLSNWCFEKEEDIRPLVASQLEACGVEVLYDDRGEKAGSMFSDADLLGIPLRLVISPKTLVENEVEFRTRACRDSVRFKVDEAAAVIAEKVKAELAKFIC